MLRRTAVVSLALAATSTAIALSAPVASAAGCTARADLPDRIAIAHDYQAVTAKLVVTCPSLGHAAMYLYGPQGPTEIFTYDRPTWDGTWDLYGFTTPGTYQSRPGYAYDVNYQDWGSIAPDTSVVKRASYVSMSVTRQGATSVFTAAVSHYDPDSTRASERSNSINVLVTYQALVNGQWVNKQQFRTNSDGRVSLTVVDPAKRTYRTVVSEAGTAFGVTSGGVSS
jgi:hypothetical protein